MKPLIINKKGTILKGILKGTKGLVIAFDSKVDEVHLSVDEHSVIITSSDNISQDEKQNAQESILTH